MIGRQLSFLGDLTKALEGGTTTVLAQEDDSQATRQLLNLRGALRTRLR
jgi:hypothetical protein